MSTKLTERRLVTRTLLLVAAGLILGGVSSGIGRRGEVATPLSEVAAMRGAKAAAGSVPTEDSRGGRRFFFDYEVEIAARAPGGGAMHVFLPIARDTVGQRIHEVRVDSPVAGRIETEPVYGNRFWHAEIPADHLGPIPIKVAYDVERRILRAGDEPGDAKEAERFLASNERVVVGHPILDPILRAIERRSPGEDKAARARAIYDWVFENLEYKKVGTGWGNGDTFWACSERYGNCTDFHSLFISLARTEGIPARFEMGFPIPVGRDEGTIAGYHCWVEFWLPETGWFPVDVSEAYKHPEKRELFFGVQPPDRVHFSTGRDLRLGSGHRDRPLNYFIYPYVEIAGKRADVALRTRFRFRDRAPDEERTRLARHAD